MIPLTTRLFSHWSIPLSTTLLQQCNSYTALKQRTRISKEEHTFGCRWNWLHTPTLPPYDSEMVLFSLLLFFSVSQVEYCICLYFLTGRRGRSQFL
jgi:hypothetical protein